MRHRRQRPTITHSTQKEGGGGLGTTTPYLHWRRRSAPRPWERCQRQPRRRPPRRHNQSSAIAAAASHPQGRCLNCCRQTPAAPPQSLATNLILAMKMTELSISVMRANQHTHRPKRTLIQPLRHLSQPNLVRSDHGADPSACHSHWHLSDRTAAPWRIAVQCLAPAGKAPSNEPGGGGCETTTKRLQNKRWPEGVAARPIAATPPTTPRQPEGCTL